MSLRRARDMISTVAPGATDDETLGYRVGDTWTDTVTPGFYVLVDATATAAVWYAPAGGGGGGGAPTGAQYLVGALDATLTAERLVTNTATVTWDLATAGQAKANVPTGTVAAEGVLRLAVSGVATAGRAVEATDSRLSDARTPTGAASGDLGGTYPSPTVTQARGLRETGGPTTLAMGAVADGQGLARSGASVVGFNPVATGRNINTTAPITGGGDLSADRTIAISDFTATTRGAVPNPGGSSGRFLKDDATWAAVSGSGLSHGQVKRRIWALE
jgi:hypothetical protein